MGAGSIYLLSAIEFGSSHSSVRLVQDFIFLLSFGSLVHFETIANIGLLPFLVSFFGSSVQVPMHSYAEEAKGVLLVCPLLLFPLYTVLRSLVCYRFSVPHDRLFLDALERDLKREKMGQESTTEIVGEPARSFTYDPKRSLYDQFSKAQGAMEGEGELEAAVRRADEAMSTESSDGHTDGSKESDAEGTASEHDESGAEDGKKDERKKANLLTSSPFFSSMFSLFEGSPTYKQRRKKVTKSRRSPSSFGAAYPAQYYGASGITAPGDYMYNMRMQEPQIDRYGRDTSRMSAAEMFTAQARGDFGPQSNPDLVAPQKERQRRAMVAHAEVRYYKKNLNSPIQY